MDCAIYRGGVVGAIDRRVTDARHTSARALSALTATYHRALARRFDRRRRALNNNMREAPPAWPRGRSFIAARSSRGEWRLPSRPIATLVYLHFAAAIRRVVGCGGAGRGWASTWLAYTPPPPQRHGATSLCQLCNE